MEKPKQSFDFNEWSARVDALTAEVDAFAAQIKGRPVVPEAASSEEKVGELVLAHEVAQPLAA